MSESELLRRIQALVSGGQYLVSNHGYDELAADGIFTSEVIDGLTAAIVVEEYPQAAKGPSVLMLQKDAAGLAVHVVWGIPKGFDGPAVLVTAYRPDPDRWSEDFTKRRKR